MHTDSMYCHVNAEHHSKRCACTTNAAKLALHPSCGVHGDHLISEHKAGMERASRMLIGSHEAAPIAGETA